MTRCKKLGANDPVEQFFLVFAFERKSGSEHEVEEDAESPNVRFEAIILFFLYYFRRHVVWSATADSKANVWAKPYAKAKIDYFDHSLVIHDHILSLYVSVHHALSMHVFESFG